MKPESGPYSVAQYGAFIATAMAICATANNFAGLLDDPVLVLQILVCLLILTIVYGAYAWRKHSVTVDFLANRTERQYKFSSSYRNASAGFALTSLATLFVFLVVNQTTYFDSATAHVFPRNKSKWLIGRTEQEYWWCETPHRGAARVYEPSILDSDLEIRRPVRNVHSFAASPQDLRVPHGTAVVTARELDLEVMPWYVRETYSTPFAPQTYTDFAGAAEEFRFSVTARQRCRFLAIEEVFVRLKAYQPLPEVNGGFPYAGAGTMDAQVFACELKPSRENNAMIPAEFISDDPTKPRPYIYVDDQHPVPIHLMLYSRTPGTYTVDISVRCRSKFGDTRELSIIREMKIVFADSPIFQDVDFVDYGKELALESSAIPAEWIVSDREKSAE